MYRAGQKEIIAKALQEIARRAALLLPKASIAVVAEEKRPLHCTEKAGHSADNPKGADHSVQSSSRLAGSFKGCGEHSNGCPVSWTAAAAEHMPQGPATHPWQRGVRVLHDVCAGAELARVPLAAGLAADSRDELLLKVAAARIQHAVGSQGSSTGQGLQEREELKNGTGSRSEAGSGGEGGRVGGGADTQLALIEDLKRLVEVPLAGRIWAAEQAAHLAAKSLSGTSHMFETV